MRYFLLIFLGLVSFSGLALADCSNPEGPAGRQMYNSTYNVMQFCDGTDWIGMAGGVSSGGAGSATTMVSGWPDALRCSGALGAIIMVYSRMEESTGMVQYYQLGDYGTVLSNSSYLNFNSVGDATGYAYNGWSGYLDGCVNKSISTLYSEGKAFNFIGNNGGSTNLNEIGDVSVAAPSDGQALVWSDGNSRWEAGSAGIISESDPQVSVVTNGKWCRGDGSAVICDQTAPSGGGGGPLPQSATAPATCNSTQGGRKYLDTSIPGYSTYKSVCTCLYYAGAWKWTWDISSSISCN